MENQVLYINTFFGKIPEWALLIILVLVAVSVILIIYGILRAMSSRNASETSSRDWVAPSSGAPQLGAAGDAQPPAGGEITALQLSGGETAGRAATDSYKNNSGSLTADVSDEAFASLIREAAIAAGRIGPDDYLTGAEVEHAKERVLRISLRGYELNTAAEIYFGKRTLDAVTGVEKRINVLSAEINDLKAKLPFCRLRESVEVIEGRIMERERALAAAKAQMNFPGRTGGPVLPKAVAESLFGGAARPGFALPSAGGAQSAAQNQPGSTALAVVGAQDGGSHMERIKELKSLIASTNAAERSLAEFEKRKAALLKKREQYQLEIEKLQTALLNAPNADEMDKCSQRITAASTDLNIVLLDFEKLNKDGATLANENYLYLARLNELIGLMGLTYSDLIRIESDLSESGSMKANYDAYGDMATSVRHAKNVAESGASESLAGAERGKAYFEDRAKVIAKQIDEQARAGGGVDSLRKDYLEQMRRANEERADFYTSLKDSREGFGGEETFSIGNVKLLPDGTIVHEDGIMIRPDGKIYIPKKAADEQEVERRMVIMAERRARARVLSQPA